MKKYKLALRVLPVAVLGLLLSAPADAFGWFWWRHHDDVAIEYEEAEIFFELNNTDKDLGIHALIDGDAWKFLSIKDTNDRNILSLFVMRSLRKQGLTELFFESAEPVFGDLDPIDFFDRFPEGEYTIKGRTLEGDLLESAAEVTHVMPAPVLNIKFNGTNAPADCDADLPVITAPVTVTWDPTTKTHPSLGDPQDSEEITIIYQTFVAEVELEIDEEDVELELLVQLPPDVGEYDIPEIYTDDADEIKVEILVREESFNQTAVETCFALENGD